MRGATRGEDHAAVGEEELLLEAEVLDHVHDAAKGVRRENEVADRRAHLGGSHELVAAARFR